jgi:chromosome segregation ATPase
MRIIQSVLLVIVIVASISYSGYVYIAGPCRAPLEYSVGRLDEGFKMSESEFLKAIAEAEAIWEEGIGKDLFVYDPDGKLPVNLIYDERQATADRNEALELEVDETKESADTVKREFETLRDTYEAREREYEALLADFKAQQADYVADVRYWNDRGGAPEGEYKKLEAEGARLKSLHASLEEKRLEVNRLAREVNSRVDAYNRLVKDINSTIETINESADKEFEQGEYISEGRSALINIYEFRERSQLVRVIAHELGHALGIDHNDNPESIMHYINKSDSLEASVEDIASLRAACRLKAGIS